MGLVPDHERGFTKPPRYCWLRLRRHNWTLVRQEVCEYNTTGLGEIRQVYVCLSCRAVKWKDFKAVLKDVRREEDNEYL